MDDNRSRRNTHGADVLRGVAILMVVGYHAAFSSLFGISFPWAGMARDFGPSPSPTTLAFYPLSLGWAGVSLFFVLSGFCIHFSTLRAGETRWGHFFWRRFWRIYPAYFLALVAFACLGKLDLGTADGSKQFLTHALFLHNVSEQTLFGINPSFWSIAAEVQLYLLFPAFLAIRSRFGTKGALVVAFLIGCAWRGIAVAAWGLPDHVISAVFASPLTCWFDWILGAYVAERFFADRPAFRSPGAWLAVLVPAFVASTLYRPATLFSFTLAAGIAAVVLDAALRREWRRSSLAGPLGSIGLVSYSLYLWHQPLVVPLKRALDARVGSPLAWVGLASALLLGSWISYHLFEKSGVRLGETLWKRRPRVVPIEARMAATA
ncbi:acyltransferase family protein [Tundrisphaera sp. TA3]|uniref:acyltransferase family protein n=1 Tax=Tundrisphaera sp. TA3 TaxID=3435775 RepID=UPI003EB8A837